MAPKEHKTSGGTQTRRVMVTIRHRNLTRVTALSRVKETSGGTQTRRVMVTIRHRDLTRVTALSRVKETSGGTQTRRVMVTIRHRDLTRVTALSRVKETSGGTQTRRVMVTIRHRDLTRVTALSRVKETRAKPIHASSLMFPLGDQSMTDPKNTDTSMTSQVHSFSRIRPGGVPDLRGGAGVESYASPHRQAAYTGGVGSVVARWRAPLSPTGPAGDRARGTHLQFCREANCASKDTRLDKAMSLAARIRRTLGPCAWRPSSRFRNLRPFA